MYLNRLALAIAEALGHKHTVLGAYYRSMGYDYPNVAAK